MNYEELLEARNDSRNKKLHLPLGDYYRQQVDGKWRGTVDIRQELNDNIIFAKALDAEIEANRKLVNRHQIHFDVVRDGDVVKRLDLETGNFISFEQLLQDNPACVAQPNFLSNVLEALVDIATYLHKQGIFHVCFSPRTVFTRKGDNAVMLLSHGSFYKGLDDQRTFYGDNADYIAPEVLDKRTVDERSDVYSIAKFMMSICDQVDIPIQYRMAYKKAMSEAPEKRYVTPQEMLTTIRKRSNSLHMLRMFIIAAVLAVVAVGIFFEFVPEVNNVEFVKPAPRQATDDLLDDGFSPEELGVANDGDSLVPDKDADRKYKAKAEEIFRKRYAKEADRILSRIYNKEHMSNSEKKFMSESESTIQELMKVQSKLGSEAGLTPERSQLVASEIIDRITNKKKKTMSTNSRGIQKNEEKE